MTADPPPALTERLASIDGVTSVTFHNRGLWVDGPLLDVEAMADAMAGLGIRLASITAIPQSVKGETTIIYHFITESTIVSFKTQTRNGALASLAGRLRAAAWAEREIRDLFAVDFPGHPNLVPLLKPSGFASGMVREAMCGPAVLANSPTSALRVK
ncbi:MAG: NADH-quinone oxidoreductase subunit C [Rhodopila sp.]|nr:NADH-quinone oxidoreductase subunit C [Rhodopila sp.]